MPKEVDRSYKAARTISTAGSAAMYVLFVLASINFAAHLYALLHTEALRALPTVAVVGLISSTFIPVPLEWLLAEFLRKFGCGKNPFEAAQTLRLIVAAILVILYSALGGLVPPLDNVSVMGGSLPISIDNGPGLGLLDVSFAVFLVCLAMVIRYSGTLKEDSDSFI